MLATVLFYVFATILVLSALKVITAKNPVHAALFLVLSFVTSSCLWIMLGVEFLSLTLIVVYVGAVMVLFLFVVMMLDIDVESMRKGFWKNLPLALLLGLIILIEMIMVLTSKPILININNTTPIIMNSTTLGLTLYTQYSYPVELASMILLLGLVVAVALTLRKDAKRGAKYQNIAKQVKVNAKDRFILVKMEAETEAQKDQGLVTDVTNKADTNSEGKK
jgi:NADH-quinone oxidoreductase subunit J